MCSFEILTPGVDIVNYLVPKWHVNSTSCKFACVWCEDDVGYLLSTTVNYFQILLVFRQLVLTCVVEIIDHLYIGF